MSKSSYQTRISRIIRLWRRTGRPSTREALHENPDMQSQDSVIMDLALAEYRLRRESGEQLTVTHFCDQFSTYRDEVRKMLDVENGISNIEEAHQVAWPKVGETFLEFNLLSVLGTGAAARVYLAQQTTLGNRKVALKVTPFGSSEAQTLGKLEHRNVVRVHSIHDDPERELWAVCMPYLGSATLLDVKNIAFRQQNVPKSARVILEAAAGDDAQPSTQDAKVPKVLREGRYYEGVAYIGAELAEGLAYTHSQGVLHRDLKPSNVLITADGCPMLLDFNLAWDAQRESFRLGGTVPYMPPEQLYATFLADQEEELPDDPRSDVFSLGVILFELLTGRLPFAVDEHANLSDTINDLMRAQLRGAPSLQDLLPQVPRRLTQAIDGCLLVEVSGRPQPLELARELRRFGIRPQLRGRRSVWAYAALAVVAALVLFGSLAAWLSYWDNLVITRVEHLQLAIEELGQEKYLEAAGHLQEAEKKRHDLTVAKWLAYCYCCGDENVMAEGILINLVNEDGDDATVLNNYAHVLIESGDSADFSIAKQVLQNASQYEPALAQAHFNRAYFNLRCPPDLKDGDGGVGSILKAISLTENPPPELHLFAAQLIQLAQLSGKLGSDEAAKLIQEQQEKAAALNKVSTATSKPGRTDELRVLKCAAPVESIPIK